MIVIAFQVSASSDWYVLIQPNPIVNLRDAMTVA